MSFASKFASRLEQTLGTRPASIALDQHGVAYYFPLDSELWVIIDVSGPSNEGNLSASLKRLAPKFLDGNVAMIHFVVERLPNATSERLFLGLGMEAVSAKYALRSLLGIPTAFDETQRELLDEALLPVADSGPIPMKAVLSGKHIADTPQSGAHENAHDALLSLISDNNTVASRKSLTFVEGEAGKGKTVLLASVAQDFGRLCADRLAIYVPLRQLPLDEGVGWTGIARLIGLVGPSAEMLAQAIKSGLAVIFLDGLDEVSGRYDRKLIGELLGLLTAKLSGNETHVVLSGRRTEARQADGEEWTFFALELPAMDSPDFRRYVHAACEKVIQDWDNLIGNVPDGFLDALSTEKVNDRVTSGVQSIVDWVIAVFPSTGKDASLFFIQGLVAIGIGLRASNRKSLRVERDHPLYIPSTLDVCLVAALFACLREQYKTVDIARSEYTAERQMEMLKALALLASSTHKVDLPTSNEFAAKIFKIDAVNNSEVYIGITRQNAKHALTYATEAAGQYRPKFLSDWIRCALLAQVILSETDVPGLTRQQALSVALSAGRSRLLFASLLPDSLAGVHLPQAWFDLLVNAAQDGAEEASANLWQLRATLGDDALIGQMPSPLPLAEIESAEFNASQLDASFSGEDFILDDSEFVACIVTNANWKRVSMIGVEFRDSILTGVTIDACEGPIKFVGCEFNDCHFLDLTSRHRPAISFVDCEFSGTKNKITQRRAPYGPSATYPIAEFEATTTDDEVTNLFEGEWLLLPEIIPGIEQRTNIAVEPSVAALKQILRKFFPTTIGQGVGVQSRDYIRLSSLGRGRMPIGSPGRDELQSMLEAVGFATGGRPDHLYAPWSSVLGGAANDQKTRTEMIDFMINQASRGPTITRLIKRLDPYYRADKA